MLRREASPVEVLEAHLDHAEKINGGLNAIVTFAPDAGERARAAERALMRGADLPSLLGLPVTIKDTIDVAGLRATSGSLVRANHIPQHDAPAVARLRRAGAIVFGKTNVSEMALDYSAENAIFGRTVNPHDAALTPGGSSGGCAAAVSACLTPVSLGSDLVGSIRIPAHFCGVVGLKPSAGSVPVAGHCPPTIGPFALGANLGPLARRVDDLALLFEVLRIDHTGKRRDLEAPFTAEAAVDTWRSQKLRVAWYADDGVTPVTSETRLAVQAAAGALADAGFIIEEARPPGVNRAPDLWLALFSGAVRRMLREAYREREDEAGPSVRVLLERPEAASVDQLGNFFDAWMERDVLRDELDRWMKRRPLLVAPVGAVPAFPHGARKVIIGEQGIGAFRAFSYAQTFNVFGLPVVTVPAGRSREGLPIGVQVIGRAHEEEVVFAAARIVETALGGWQPPVISVSTA